MTPKDKAKELVGKMALHVNDVLFENAKETAVGCALICVDEILTIARESQDPDHIAWWVEAKQEIEKL